ncbi:hypothetical protein OH492_10210 [Vibrio chagasii]|nr:hypothetical protein [Vibrio chagasii]
MVVGYKGTLLNRYQMMNFLLGNKFTCELEAQSWCTRIPCHASVSGRSAKLMLNSVGDVENPRLEQLLGSRYASERRMTYRAGKTQRHYDETGLGDSVVKGEALPRASG